jgi:drug/metabolite transporter (DMT)-like permease
MVVSEPVSAAAVLLALASAAVWGTADFSGGLISRRVATIPVTVISQAAGFVAILIALEIAGGGIDRHSFGIGILAGIGGGTGLAAFYKALSLGTMSIVSPVVACGAVVPFAVAIATGERPSGVAFAGAGLAIGGAVLASAEERHATEANRGRAVALAVAAAVALGLFTYFLGLGSREGSALSTLTGARVGSLGFLLLLAASRRESLRVGRHWVLPIVGIGLLDMSANALFAFASRHGLLSLVSVLGSLYPVMTILLAYLVLHERLSRVQLAGVATALVGVAALSAG